MPTVLCWAWWEAAALRFFVTSGYFSPSTFQEAKVHPFFSCACSIKEATDKEEERCLKTLENAKIRSKNDGEIVSVCHGGKPRSLVVLTLGEGDLGNRHHESWTG